MSKKISVVITTHNRPHFLRSCLLALTRQNLNINDFEVIVVDSYSEKGYENKKIVQDIKFQHGLKISYYYNPVIGGSTCSKNLAVSLCSTNNIAYVDDDSLPSPTYLSEALRALSKEGVELVVGRMVPKYMEMPKKKLETTLKNTYAGGYYISEFTVIDLGDEEMDVPWYLGFSSIAAFKKDFYLNAGGSGPDGFSYPYLFWNGSGEHHYTKKAKRILYAPNMISEHIILSDRLERRYFYIRAFFNGIAESFDYFRENNQIKYYYPKVIMKIIKYFIYMIKKFLKLDSFNAFRTFYFLKGFLYHQYFILKSPELRNFCLLESWIQYDFTKLKPMGSNTMLSQWNFVGRKSK